MDRPRCLAAVARCGLKAHRGLHGRLGFQRVHERAQLALPAEIPLSHNLEKQFRGGIDCVRAAACRSRRRLSMAVSLLTRVRRGNRSGRDADTFLFANAQLPTHRVDRAGHFTSYGAKTVSVLLESLNFGNATSNGNHLLKSGLHQFQSVALCHFTSAFGMRRRRRLFARDKRLSVSARPAKLARAACRPWVRMANA